MANAVETPSQNNLMTEGSIVKSLLLFALPLIFGNLLQQLYNTADSIIVGNFVGANALAAVGSSGSPIYLLIGFSQGLAVGAGVVVSQFLGAKDHREAQEAVHTSLAIAVIMGLLLTVGGIACGRALLVAMNTPAEVLGDAVIYIRIYFGGVLFSVVYNMTAGILNAAGNSRRSLIYLAWASVTNIVLDLVFIVIFRMGVAGGRHRHRYQPAGVLRAEPAVSDKIHRRLPGDSPRDPPAQKDGRPHHPGGPAHRHPEHGHLLFQRAGAGQREQLRCRRHGRVCRLHEDRRL